MLYWYFKLYAILLCYTTTYNMIIYTVKEFKYYTGVYYMCTACLVIFFLIALV